MVGSNKRLLILCAITIATKLIKTVASKTDYTKPNILLLYADDLGIGDLKAYNSDSKIPTPNLDKLVATGRVFLDAHSSAGTCSPSRYSLLTGRYHWRKFTKVVQSFGASKISPTRFTLAKMLNQVGYHTSLIGKWHLGWHWDAIRRGKKTLHPRDFVWRRRIPQGPVQNGGFQYYFGEDVINFPPYCWFENETVVGNHPTGYFGRAAYDRLRQKEGKIFHRPGPMVRGWDFYDVLPTLIEKGVRYIQVQHSPWFLMFSFPSPHLPIIPQNRFDGTSGAGPYGDAVVELDDAVGQLLQAVEDAGQTDNTLVIFASDNGAESIAYSRALKYNHWSSGPLRGLKRDLYEGGHRVPLVIKWPNGGVPAGTVSRALVSQIDFMATIAAIVGIDVPSSAAEDSFNLLDEFRGVSAKAVRKTMVYNSVAGQFAVRYMNYVYTAQRNGYTRDNPPIAWRQKYAYVNDGTEQGQLFNLTTDVGQRKNLLLKDIDAETLKRVEFLKAIFIAIRRNPETKISQLLSLGQ